MPLLLAWSELLAQTPDSTMFINPWKLLAYVLLYAIWVLFAQWVDKDTIAVNTFRQIWNMVTSVVGIVSLLVLLLIPDFLFASLAFVVINGALITIYVVHRNGLVVPDSRVLTAAHIQRVINEGFGGKAKQKLMEVKELVRINGADRKLITASEDPVERAQYALAQQLLFDMLHRRAAIMLVEPAGEAARIKLSIDGIVAEREPMPRADAEGFVHFIKRIGALSLEERRKPQKGTIFAQIGETKFDVVVRTTGSSAGESLMLRTLGLEKTGRVADLGLTEQQLDTFRNSVMYGDRGLVLVTSPPRQGLTTSIYSISRSHDAFLQNIQMLEYERELDIENITQKAYTPSQEATFAAELLKMVRTDPNVIVVPDLRDAATAKVACDAAAKKQIVYVGLNSADLFDGLAKFIQLAGDAALVARSIAAVTHQRLIRKLCDACKAPYKPDPASMAKINLPADKILHRPPEPQYDKRGNPIICPACQGTGYVGRTAVFALLVIDDDLRKVIKAGGSAADLKTTAAKKGVLGLQQQALSKVLDGVTSIDEVARATRAAAPAKPQPAPPAKAPTA